MLRLAMRLLSSQVRYAICGIFDLGYNAQTEPVQLRVIGERQKIPARYLEQIFQRLRRAGIVIGKRGPGGGYTLGRGTTEISLRDIVEAVEGPIECGKAGAADSTASASDLGAGEASHCEPPDCGPLLRNDSNLIRRHTSEFKAMLNLFSM